MRSVVGGNKHGDWEGDCPKDEHGPPEGEDATGEAKRSPGAEGGTDWPADQVGGEQGHRAGWAKRATIGASYQEQHALGGTCVSHPPRVEQRTNPIHPSVALVVNETLYDKQTYM